MLRMILAILATCIFGALLVFSLHRGAYTMGYERGQLDFQKGYIRYLEIDNQVRDLTKWGEDK